MRMSLTTFVCALLSAWVLCGCATRAPMSPVNQRLSVRGVLDQWKQAVAAKDSEAAMPTLSDEFLSKRFGNKQAYKNTLEEYFGDGSLNNAEIDLDGAQIAFENGIAIAYPVHVKSASGAYNLSFFLRREDDKTWRIFDMNMDAL